HHSSADQIGIVTIADGNRRRQDRTVLDVRYDSLGPLAAPVYQNNLARTSAHDHRQKARRADRTRASDSNLHIRFSYRHNNVYLATLYGGAGTNRSSPPKGRARCPSLRLRSCWRFPASATGS